MLWSTDVNYYHLQMSLLTTLCNGPKTDTMHSTQYLHTEMCWPRVSGLCPTFPIKKLTNSKWTCLFFKMAPGNRWQPSECAQRQRLALGQVYFNFLSFFQFSLMLFLSSLPQIHQAQILLHYPRILMETKLIPLSMTMQLINRIWMPQTNTTHLPWLTRLMLLITILKVNTTAINILTLIRNLFNHPH